MDISDRKKLEREAENFKTLQQRAVLLATLDAQEKERVKISGALHDSVCQLLYGIRINLQGLPFYKDNAEAFKNINQLLDQAIQETRTISYELRPSVLNDFGFTAGINEMAKRLTTPQFAVKATISPGADKLSSTIQLHAFRIIQELVNNCIKHAQATRAEIVVCTEQDSVHLSVTDNGKGFKDDLKESLVKGSGLRAIKNQLYFLKGELDFKITKRGTAVSVSFNKNIELTEN
jgi:signal transduction histidine kinase